jgi:outer membrane protein insertion porin family
MNRLNQMRTRKPSISILFACVGLILASCSNIKYLPAGEQLYTGASVRIDPKETVRKKHIKSELEDIIRPKPNSSILGLRPKLWFYNIAGENSKKGIRKWLRTKIGEPPVLLSQVDPYLIENLMKSRLDNMGYFKSKTKHEVQQKKRKAEIEYLATVANPYKLNEINYPQGDDSLSIAIRATQNKSLIYTGVQYDLNLLIDERARIDNELKNQGYYYFNPDFLVYKIDTSAGNRQIDVLLGVKPETPEKALNIYRLNKIYVIPQYSLTRKSRRLERDTTYAHDYYFIERMSNYRHKALARYIKIKEGEVYSKKDHDLTISRLMGMGVFKFVSVKFNDTSTNNTSLLDARINLTQLLPRSLKVDISIGAKSNNYTGPSVTLSYKNRNLWRGAEFLQLSLNGAYEVQLSGRNKGFNSWELGGGIQLVTPTFLVPFNIRHESSLNIPKTKFDLEFRTLHRVQYFDMDGINFTFGYIWRENERKQYEINPIAINFSKLRNTTPEFDAILLNNQYLRRSFEEQFTLGSTASYTYNTLTGITQRDQYYLNLMLDLSGNSAYLANRIETGENSTDERPYKIFGSRFSQYVKLSTDFRYYNNFDKNNKLASRIIIGSGIPYGNSLVMPYSKQFFSGGSNSIRAFLPRSLGPGSYHIDDELESGFFDQSGDIKLEMNLEFRFGLISVLKGALFTDAGNVWLMRSNESLPGGEFKGNRFMKELAVGTGFGLRVDLSFFLIRLDLGVPLRKPWLSENERWVFDEISFGSRDWRRENLVYNIAIGYPF